MKVYIAAPWSDRDVVRTYLEELAAIGYQPACSWPDLLDPADPDVSADQRAGVASKALEEVRACGIVVLLTDRHDDDLVDDRGGRHVEVGIALARGRRVLVVGEPENAFHWLDQVDRVPDWHAAVVHLARLLVDQPRPRKRRTGSTDLVTVADVVEVPGELVDPGGAP